MKHPLFALGLMLAACGTVEMSGPTPDAPPVPDTDAPDSVDAPDTDAPDTDAPPPDAPPPDAPMACPPCASGEVCGILTDYTCDAVPAMKLRNGFVQSDGRASHSQTCDIAADGTIDCALATHPFTTFTLPPSGVQLPPGVGIADRTVFVYRSPAGNRLFTGFLQTDGAREWVQTCALPTGPLACDPQTSPYVAVDLPPPGVTLDAGTHIGGRFGYVVIVDGRMKVRNGYVQSDGRRSFSQDCDIGANGALNCGLFSTTTLPPGGIQPDNQTIISDAYTFTYASGGAMRLRNGYVQSDGSKAWSQTCALSPAGVADCDATVHPFTTFPMPPTGVTPAAGTTLTHRFAFTYLE